MEPCIIDRRSNLLMTAGKHNSASISNQAKHYSCTSCIIVEPRFEKMQENARRQNRMPVVAPRSWLLIWIVAIGLGVSHSHWAILQRRCFICTHYKLFWFVVDTLQPIIVCVGWGSSSTYQLISNPIGTFAFPSRSQKWNHNDHLVIACKYAQSCVISLTPCLNHRQAAIFERRS
jgi:hypothetical protein